MCAFWNSQIDFSGFFFARLNDQRNRDYFIVTNVKCDAIAKTMEHLLLILLSFFLSVRFLLLSSIRLAAVLRWQSHYGQLQMFEKTKNSLQLSCWETEKKLYYKWSFVDDDRPTMWSRNITFAMLSIFKKRNVITQRMCVRTRMHQQWTEQMKYNARRNNCGFQMKCEQKQIEEYEKRANDDVDTTKKRRAKKKIVVDARKRHLEITVLSATWSLCDQLNLKNKNNVGPEQMALKTMKTYRKRASLRFRIDVANYARARIHRHIINRPREIENVNDLYEIHNLSVCIANTQRKLRAYPGLFVHPFMVWHRTNDELKLNAEAVCYFACSLCSIASDKFHFI